MYADSTFYTEEYKGKAIPEAELDSFLSRASDSVDQLTFFRIRQRGGIDKLTPFQQRNVKLATCIQADFLHGVQDMPEWVQSYSVGSVSVTKKDKVSTEFSPHAILYLRPTNLTYRGLA